MAKHKSKSTLRTPGLKTLHDSASSRKRQNRRARRYNANLNYEAENERNVVIDGEPSGLPAPGWGTTEGDVPGWRSPRRNAPATVSATEVAVNTTVSIDGHDVVFPVSEANRKSVAARDENGRPLRIQRSYTVDSRFCIDSYCGAQLQDGRCPNGHGQKRQKRQP